MTHNTGYGFSITDEDIDDVLVTAFETGIGYWAESAKPVGGNWDNPNDYYYNILSETDESGHLRKISITDDDGNRGLLTRDKLFKAINEYATGEYTYSEDLIEDGKFDMNAVDAEVADAIVQIAIFGELVYG